MTEETRSNLFRQLKACLQQFSPPFVITRDEIDTSFELIGNKPVPYGYDKKMIPGMFFASLAQRKNSVTFHFFPCYMNAAAQEYAPSLYRCLKGKTCFHFTKESQLIEHELLALLNYGSQVWYKSGYMLPVS